MPTSTKYSQTDFPAILKWQALAFMRVEWPYIFEDDERFLTETYPPALEPIHFVVTEGETLMSYAAVIHTTMEHASHTYKVCGFGNMFTFPPYRGEGHGRKVLQMATDTIIQSDLDLAILYCEPKRTAFYEHAGWAITHSPTRFGNETKYEDHDEERMMLSLSDKGKQGRADFDTHPVYVDWTW